MLKYLACTGGYFETGDKAGNGMARPAPGTHCVGECQMTPGSRWGESFCYTEDTAAWIEAGKPPTAEPQWGAGCHNCYGIHYDNTVSCHNITSIVKDPRF